ETWYRQAGTPELVCDLAYDAKSQTAELTVEQVLPPTPGEARKRALHIPLRMGLLSSNGQDLPLTLANGDGVEDGVLHVTRRSQKFKFKNVPSRPVPSYLRGFSAPVRLTTELSDRDLAFLMANDGDLFARWQASTDYATRILVQLTRARDPKSHLARVDAYARALQASLQNDELSHSYRAELLRLPSESDIAREIANNVDPARIHDARKLVLKEVGRIAGATLEALYESCASKAPFSPEQDDAGRRALRNSALSVLVARGTKSDKARLVAHFDHANSMTDQAHALYLLAAASGPQRTAALDAFYKQWSDDHLVVDTWFAAQAAAPTASTLATVRKLVKHEKFTFRTPNKVRAVIGTFALQNPAQFNRPDGGGYRFVAQQVMALDRINPQVAARLLNAFRSWRTMEPGRRAKAQAALEELAQSKSLSRDVYEIASKMVD
ncbi:MAG: DUF3458 domain-containing protein, partial [Hyphomicrobiaceae bacterium]|nr:DUF3458 domain-containing protein [Hyphomicrobiaceae bacterium]